jgi:hypothetical protein
VIPETYSCGGIFGGRFGGLLLRFLGRLFELLDLLLQVLHLLLEAIDRCPLATCKLLETPEARVRFRLLNPLRFDLQGGQTSALYSRGRPLQSLTTLFCSSNCTERAAFSI